MPLERMAVIGGGAWGTALAQTMAASGRAATLVARDPAVVEDINRNHRNSRHLGALPLSPALKAASAMPEADLVVLAVPAQQTRAALATIAGRLAGLPVVLTAKGLETGTTKRQSEILADEAPGAIPYVLSGPSFAADVAAGMPTAVTLAGDDAAATEAVAAALAGASFRPYAAGDRIGVELAGALKNVYALGCGAVDGAGFGPSTRAGMIARAFAELGRLIVALGGAAATTGGLAGLGDLTLSCTSVQSRNYRTGFALGSGRSREGIGLAEGVATAPVAQALARQAGIDAPLVDAVNLLLDGRTSIGAIVEGLMSRPLKRED